MARTLSQIRQTAQLATVRSTGTAFPGRMKIYDSRGLVALASLTAGRLPLRGDLISRTKRFPRTRAARVNVSRDTDVFCGSSRRSSCERLVFNSLAIACLVLCWRLISCSNCHASTRLIAADSTSSRIPSSSRKPSKEEPLWTFDFSFAMFYFLPFISASYIRLFLRASSMSPVGVFCVFFTNP